MNRATPKIRDWAESLIAYETSLTSGESCDAVTPSLFSTAEKLRPHFAALMGSVGFRALLTRALSLAAADVSWLRAVQVTADGGCEELAPAEGQPDPEKIAEGRVAVLAQLLGLMVAFIGEGLTLRLLSEVWPGLSLDGLDLGAGAKNEKAE